MGGSEPDANLVVPFYETPPNQRHFTPVNVDRGGLRGFGQGLGWYASTLIDDPRGTGKQYRWIGIDHATAMPQQLCDEEGHNCEQGYQGFTLDDVRVLCEVTR